MAAGLRTKQNLVWLTVAALAGLMLHAVFVAETLRRPAFAIPLVDAADCHRQAARAAAGGAAPAQPYWQPPLYVWWLGAVYRVLGPHPAAARLLQSLFTAGAAAMAWLLARRMCGPRWSAAAGLAVALSGTQLLFAAQLLPTALGVLLGAAAVWTVLRAASRGQWRWAAAGLSIGAAGLAVPTLFSLAAAAGWALPWRQRGDRPGGPRRALAGLGLLAAGLAVCVAPVTIRNRAVAGQWVVLSSNTGINFYLGNNARWRKTVAIRPGLDWDRLAAEPFHAGARDAAEADRYFLRRAVAYLRREPAAWAAGLAAKLRHVFLGREVPRNVGLYALVRRSAVLRPLVWRAGSFGFPFGVLLPLATLGAVRTRRLREGRLLALSCIVYALGLALFFPSSRYRAPMLPWLAALAAGGLAVSVPQWRRDRRRAGSDLALVLLTGVAVNLPAVLPTDGLALEAELENAIGAGLDVRGRRAEAVEHYRRAIALAPACFEAHFNLGNRLRGAGRPREAVEHYRRALRQRPDYVQAMANCALAHVEAGEPQQALGLLEKAAGLEPRNSRVHGNLGVCYVRAGRTEEGLRHLRRALALDPRNADAAANLARLLENPGRAQGRN